MALLWFSEQQADKIARMTPQGQFTEYHVPTPNGIIGPLTLGPDDNLWFAEASSNKIGALPFLELSLSFPFRPQQVILLKLLQVLTAIFGLPNLI